MLQPGAYMLAIAAITLLAATGAIDSQDLQESEFAELEMAFEDGLETGMQGDEIVLDDSLLLDAESEMLELEE
jgi:hypothetical protein